MLPFLRRTLLGAALILTLTAAAQAQSSAETTLRLPNIFSDNMVLQANDVAPVWGWAAPGAEVVVRLGGVEARAKTGAEGRWRADLKNLKTSSDPQTLRVTCGETTLERGNVLVGDVWIGSGQSNMEFPLEQAANAEQEIAAADYPQIRLFDVPNVMKAQRAEDVDAQWQVCTPETVRRFSALLYLYGRELHQETDLPMGLIHSSVGGTRIELWTPPEGFASIPEFEHYAESIETTQRRFHEELPAKLDAAETWLAEARAALAAGRPVPVTPDWPEMQHPEGGAAVLYNSMILPLLPYGIRGAIWYQGEWNGGEGDLYFKRMQALIGGWRDVWNRPELPFYFVQLARYPQEQHEPWLGDGWAPTREAQRRSLTIPHTGMATIIDLEGNSNYHPVNKQDPASRLARWALRNEYSREDVVVSGPVYRDMEREDGRIRLHFDYVDGGLMTGAKDGLEPVRPTPGEPLQGFAVAGENRAWAPAEAKIDGDTVVVSSPDVPAPVAVRYAYSQDPVGLNLYNQAGLPASPFRTDSW